MNVKVDVYKSRKGQFIFIDSEFEGQRPPSFIFEKVGTKQIEFEEAARDIDAEDVEVYAVILNGEVASTHTCPVVAKRIARARGGKVITCKGEE